MSKETAAVMSQLDKAISGLGNLCTNLDNLREKARHSALSDRDETLIRYEVEHYLLFRARKVGVEH